MRILKAPITKTGQVRYVELVKWLFVVMTVVMSFSYVINSLEEELLTLINGFNLISFGVFTFEIIRTLYEGLKELKRQVESYLIPWIKRQVLKGKEILLTIQSSSPRYGKEIRIKTFDFTHSCVMRC